MINLWNYQDAGMYTEAVPVLCLKLKQLVLTTTGFNSHDYFDSHVTEDNLPCLERALDLSLMHQCHFITSFLKAGQRDHRTVQQLFVRILAR